MDLTSLLIQTLAKPLAVVLIRSAAGDSAGTVGGGLTGIVARLVKNQYKRRKLERQWEEIGERIVQRLEPRFQQAVNEGGVDVPTILFAAASATPGFADRLVERLLNMDATSLARMRRWLGGADPSRARKLFAVRCGEMALHLEQGTRQRLKEILKDSNRPLTISESESFAALGDFIVPHLVYDPSLPAKTLVACVRSLTLIGTPAAKNCLKTYCGERRTTVVSELKQVLDPLELLVVQEQLEPILQHAPSVREELQRAPLPTVLRGRATLEFDSLPDLDLTPLTELAELTGLRQVHVLGSPLPASLDRLAALNLNKRLQGRVRYINSIGMHFSPIRAGEFVMGASDLPDARQHRVRLTQPFLLGVFSVTQAEYQRVMGENPSRFDDDARRPVEKVSWHDAQEFCRRMSEQERVTYRLPTEAEWEYACRAGSTGAWCFGDDESQVEEYAWYSENSGGDTHAVGQKKSNAWGLHDMHGNVWEWCSDWYSADYYANSPLEDPKGPERATFRVFLGGSWGLGARYCRAAFRFGLVPGFRFVHLGFRVAAVPLSPVQPGPVPLAEPVA